MAPGNGTVGKVEKIGTNFFIPRFQWFRARNRSPGLSKSKKCAEIKHFPFEARGVVDSKLAVIGDWVDTITFNRARADLRLGAD